MKTIIVSITLILCFGINSISQNCTFTNPVKPPESADPYVIFKNGFYYYMTTITENTLN